jgi:Adenylate kinase and related kinases
MKIYIVGAVSSGKTTLARKLSEKLNIRYQSLDELVHIPDKSNPWGNKKRELKERDNLFHSVIQQSMWIIEDTGRPCFIEGLEAADTIVLLEVPTRIRNYRIIKRWIKQRLRIEKCIYNPNLHMLKSMLQWSKDYDLGIDKLKERISPYQEKVIVLNNDREIKNFINKALYNKDSYI